MIARHPLPLLTNEVPRIVLHRQHTIVLAQDLHAPFTNWEAGWLVQRARSKVLMREFDEYREALALVRPNICRTLETVRSLGINVVYSCLGYRPPEQPSAFQTATGWTWDLNGPDGAFPKDVAPTSEELIFTKPGWSALADPAFVQYLTTANIHNAILLGAMFEFGIRQSSLDLADHGISVLVVSDGVVALTQAGEKQTRGELAHGLIKLRTTGELLDLLARLSDEECVHV
ncbi:cysteine hydrolase [Chloroflexi bacterium TSY]|nr:cysteine hydrolase [Chloroflexi bacterium TSY]